MLEFILLNHPLDCPVCDKGGECPLQDLTYRYGPGNTRFHLNKRTYEKPLAISPLIALDRERCILCYRCTRFSQDVAEDEQLVARERGASSVIATFEEQPYRGRFSGNVIELCPVGALTSTDYRFQARPWEINNVPSVCGQCAVGCNTWGTVREGGVRRVLSRNHPEVDEGWLCDRGRFTHDHITAGDRYLGGLIRGPRGLDAATPEQIAETIARRLRHHASLHGPDSIARARVRRAEQRGGPAPGPSSCARPAAGRSSRPASRVPAPGTALAPYAARIADLDGADVIVVAGERELGDAAGVLELRVRQAVRHGARLLLAGSGGGDLDIVATGRIAAGEVADALRAAARPVLIATDPAAVAAAAATAHAAGLGHGPGGVLALPDGPNERGLHALGYTRRRRDRARTRRGRDAADARRARRRRRALALPGARALGGRAAALRVGRRQLALPDADGALGARHPPRHLGAGEGRHDHEPRGPHAAPAPVPAAAGRRRARARPCSPPPAAISSSSSPASPSRAFARVAAASPLFAGLTWESIGRRAPLAAERPRPGAAPAAPRAAHGRERRGPARDRPPAALLRRRRRAHASASPSSAATRSCSRAPTRCGSASPRARRVTVRHAGGATTGPARLSRTLAPRAPCASPGTALRSTATAAWRWLA